MQPQTKPAAELYIATGCAHCPAVLNALSELLKKGQLSTLNITNIAVDNQRADALGIRSVPWLRLGKFILPGVYPQSELQHWAQRATTAEGMAEYIETMLNNGELNPVQQTLQLDPESITAVIPLLANEDTAMQVRIGIDAILEQLSATPVLNALIPGLTQLAQQDNPRVQIDALHYLALTANPSVEPVLRQQHASATAIVQQAAEEALQTLHELQAAATEN